MDIGKHTHKPHRIIYTEMFNIMLEDLLELLPTNLVRQVITEIKEDMDVRIVRPFNLIKIITNGYR